MVHQSVIPLKLSPSNFATNGLSWCRAPFWDFEERLSNISESSPYLKENTTLHHYKDQLVNAV
jgi:hypothetical protein